MRQYNKPDLSAPRYFVKTLKIINQEFFDKFRKEYPDLLLSNKDIRKTIHIFNELCVDQIANNRDGLELPEQLGFILVGSCKKKEPPIDEKLSSELELEIQQKNWESNQWLCKVCYTNFASKYKFRNSNLWAFEAGRVLKRKASAAYKENYKKYVVLDNFRKLNHLFQDANKAVMEKVYKNKQEQQNEQE